MKVNIFEEDVFDDTSYTVCSFQFTKRKYNKELGDTVTIPAVIFPKKKNIVLRLYKNANWLLGGEIYNLHQNPNITVSRGDIENPPNTRLLLTAIDSGTRHGRIRLAYIDTNALDAETRSHYLDTSSRTFAILNITPKPSVQMQHRIVLLFNTYLEKMRKRYHSLFLTNYRESKEYARKRISFELAYSIINYIMNEVRTTKI
jgi:hypothetical protein